MPLEKPATPAARGGAGGRRLGSGSREELARTHGLASRSRNPKAFCFSEKEIGLFSIYLNLNFYSTLLLGDTAEFPRQTPWMQIFILLVSSLLAPSTRIFFHWQAKQEDLALFISRFVWPLLVQSRAEQQCSLLRLRSTRDGEPVVVGANSSSLPSPESSGRLKRRDVKPDAKRLCFLQFYAPIPCLLGSMHRSIDKGERRMLATHALQLKPRERTCFFLPDALLVSSPAADIDRVCVLNTKRRLVFIWFFVCGCQ